MYSGRADRRASGIDVGVNIERWQADTIVRKDHDSGTGPVGLLFNSVIELLRLILIDMKTRPTMSRNYQSLESSCAALFFWDTDLGVARGELDEVLQDSVQLRDVCLMVLVSIGHLLISSSVVLLSSKDRQKEIFDSTGILSSLEQAMNIIDYQHLPTHQLEQNEEALCQILRLKIDTLIMLGPSLASPAEESFDDEKPRAIEQVERHLPEQAYINSVAQRFPLAASAIVTRLGKLNWDRYNHMLRLRQDSVQQELETTVMAKAKTIFHDSALGSSVPAYSEADLGTTRVSSHPQSIYAPSIVSSRAEASHRRLPHLPPQARSGQPFACAICNKQVRYQRTKAWKKHIFDDILAYACLFTECPVADVFFEDRDAMMSHLEQCHGLDVSISKVTCPLCLEYSSGSRDALSLHFSRHMEEIALAILPSCVDSDDGSEDGTSSEADTRPSISEPTLFRTNDDEPDPAIDRAVKQAVEKAAGKASEKAYNKATSANEPCDEKVDDDQVIRCVCGHQEYPGLPSDEGGCSFDIIAYDDVDADVFIRCDICKVVQHRGCVSIAHEDREYFCEVCRPDMHKQMISSTGRKQSQYIPANPNLNRKASANERFPHEPTSLGAYSDIYSCTYHGCSQHFETLQRLRKHKLEDHYRKADAKPGPSNYWSGSELQDLERYIADFGKDWLVIAASMGTKTQTMVRHQYLRLVEQGRTDLKEIAESRSAQKEHHSLREEKEGKDSQTEQALIGFHTDIKLTLEKAAREENLRKEGLGRLQSPSPSLAPSSQYTNNYTENSTSIMISRRKPRVKSEKRSQAMTIWWADRKARRKKKEEEANEKEAKEKKGAPE